MKNNFLNGLLVVMWSLTFSWDYQMLPFAIVGTIYWFVEVLFFTPTTPRGKLPPLDYIYARAFFNSLFCMKSRQLKDNDKDVVPLISADAVNILFPLDKLWDYDTAITNAIDKDCTDPLIAAYLTKTPLEKEEMKNALVTTTTTTTTTKKQDTIQLHEKDKALITKHMQRINTIPLTISPSYYLVPAFNMDASVQTFMYFPLSFWSAATLTTTDITTFFPVPRGAQFFFETSIINIRPVPNTSDLLVDIETSILIDKLRLERGYRDEQQEDEMLAKKFDEIKQVDEAIKQIEAQEEQDVDELQDLQHRYDQLHKELTVFFHNDDIKQGVSSGKSTANMLTLKLKKEEEEKMDLVVMKKNRKKQKQEAQELVLVARVVTSYTYIGGMGPGYDLSTQYHLPASQQQQQQQQQSAENVAIEQQLDQILYNGDDTKQHPLLSASPLATLRTTPKDTTAFAHLTENTHPKMLNGFVPSLLGYNEQNNNHNQFDAIYPTHLALSVYQAINGDALVKNGVEYSLFDKHISPEATNAVPADDAVKNMYPFRCILKTNAECMAPATIKVFFDRTAAPAANHIEHRGYTFAKFQKQREQEKKKAEKKKQQDDGVVAAEDLSEHIAEPPADQEISTQAFPQFTKRHDVIITVDDDAGNPVVWADGMILTQPQL